MTMMNLKFETYLLNEETVRLLGVYHEAWEAQREAQWEALLEAGQALYAHCEEAHGLYYNQSWDLYEYWRRRQ